MFKQYVLLFITVILIPVTTNDGDIMSFIKYVSERNWQRFILRLSWKFLNSSDYFMRYLIQSTFISNMLAFTKITEKVYLWLMSK